VPPAAEDPATTAALAAHQAGAVRWLGGGIIGVVLGVLLGAVVVGTVVDPAGDGRRLPGVGLLVLVLVLGGVVAGGIGTGALQRGVRWRRALRTSPWQVGRLRIAGPAVLAFERDGDVEACDGPVRLQLMSTAVWRARAVQRLDGAQVRAAPVGDAEWLLTADGLTTVVGARQVPRPR
jgi:hypothetical protein